MSTKSHHLLILALLEGMLRWFNTLLDVVDFSTASDAVAEGPSRLHVITSVDNVD